MTAVAACVFGGRHHIAYGDRAPVVQTGAPDLSVGGTERLYLRTAWIKVSGVVGFQRVRRLFLLGTFQEAGCTVRLYHDGESSPASEFTFTGTGSEEEVSIQVQRQKCRSISVELFGAIEVVRLRFEIGAKRGAYKPVNRRL